MNSSTTLLLCHRSSKWLCCALALLMLPSVRAAIGDTWTKVPTPTTSGLESVIWTGSVYLAVGANGDVITSPDGTNWSWQFTPTSQHLLNVASNGATHVAVGENGTVMTSSSINATNWVLRTSGLATGVHINGVCWTGSQFIFAGSAGNIRTSPDGITWTARTSGTAQHLNNVAWLGTGAIAVGNAGVILTSTDGISWTARASGVTTGLYDAVQTSSTTVVCGISGTLLTSTNLSTWTKQTTGTTAWIGGLAWTGSRVIAVADSDTLLTSSSSTGSSWTLRAPNSGTWLSGVAYYNGRAVTCGGSGTVIVSDNALPQVSFGTYPVAVREDSGSARILLRLSSTPTTQVTVPLTYSGSANSPADYTQVASVSFAVGEASKVVMLPLVADTVGEASETVTVSIGTPTGATSNGQSISIVLQDNNPVVHFRQAFQNASEGDGSVIVSLELDRAPVSQVSVSFMPENALGDSATPGVDFLIPAQAVFAPGQTQLSVSVPLVNDAKVEGEEFIKLRLTGGVGCGVAEPSWCILRLKDDDAAPVLGRDWTQRTPQPVQGGILALASSNVRVVAVGEQGLVMTSLDGASWTTRSSGVLADLTTVVWTGTQFVAAGNEGCVITSPDGIAWTSRQRYDVSSVTSMVWDGSKLVALASSSSFTTEVLTSTDGIVWIRRRLPIYASRLVWTDTQLIAAGYYGVMATSTNGEDWKTQMGLPFPVNAFSSNGTRVVAVCTYEDINGYQPPQSYIYTSPDGITWTQRMSPPAIKGFADVAWTGTQFVAVGRGGLAATSPDGITWTQRTVLAEEQLNCVANTSAGLIAGGAAAHLYGSVDGVTWTSRLALNTGRNLTDVTWTGSQFVAVGAGGLVMTSPDGLGWIERSLPGGGVATQVGGNGTRIVAWGTANVFWHSTDAITWTPGTQADFIPRAVMANSTTFIAVGVKPSTGEGRTLTSTNGTTWTDRAITNNPNLYEAAWNGSLWCAIGYDSVLYRSVIYTSPDAVTWTSRTLPSSATGDSWRSIAWNGSEFLINSWSESARSSTGSTWTLDAAAPLYGDRVAAAGSVFVAAAFDGTLCIAGRAGVALRQELVPLRQNDDGSVQLVAEQILARMAWNGTRLVGVGKFGRIWTSQGGDPRSVLAHFQSPTTTVTEGQGDVSIVVEMGDVASSTTSIPFYVGGSSAQAGIDFTVKTSSPLVFTPGQTTKTIVISPLDDFLDESSESFQLTLGTPTGAQTVTLVSPTAHTVTIAANATRIVFFASPASTVNEAAGPVSVPVLLSSAAPTDTWVPLMMAGTATQGVDYSVATPWIYFPAGTTTAAVMLNMLNDTVSESSETLILTLASPVGSATKLAPSPMATFTITDDDLAPMLTSVPSDVLISRDNLDSLQLIAAATGAGTLTWMWFKDDVQLTYTGTNTATLDLSALPYSTENKAGRYKVRVSSAYGTATSADIQVAWVNQHWQPEVVVKRGTTAVVDAPAAGPGLSFQWLRDDTPLVGATSSKLTINNVTTAHAGAYKCIVRLGASQLTSGATILTVPQLPQLEVPYLGSHYIGETVEIGITSTEQPTRFTVSGLPPGYRYDATSGIISGRATTAGTYTVRMNATNIEGTGPTISAPLVIKPMPSGLAGSYTGLAVAEEYATDRFGARLDFTVASNATVSGKVSVGKFIYPFTAVLDVSYDGSAIGVFTVTRTGLPNLVINSNFTIGPDYVYGSVSQGGPATDFYGWRNCWTTARLPAQYKGYHTFALTLPDALKGQPDLPPGTSFGTMTVAANGAITLTTKLSDGSAGTSSLFVGAEGQVHLYHSLYTGSGALVGTMDVQVDPGLNYANNLLTGQARWLRKPQPAGTRSYPAGFFMDALTIRGSRYAALAAGRNILDAPDSAGNAVLEFSDGGLGTHIPGVTFRLAANNTIVMPAGGSVLNPERTTLAVAASTGLFSGSFTLYDPDPINLGRTVKRVVSYQGAILRDVDSGTRSGIGWFTLPHLADPFATPPTTTLTSPIEAGGVELREAP